LLSSLHSLTAVLFSFPFPFPAVTGGKLFIVLGGQFGIAVISAVV
jgi:hypothetical protein